VCFSLSRFLVTHIQPPLPLSSFPFLLTYLTYPHPHSFQSKLSKPMHNFFRRIQPQAPVLRNNYFIQVDDKLAWSESIGSEDATAEEGGIGWFTAEKNRAVEWHWFRSERQSLRRYVFSFLFVFLFLRLNGLGWVEVCWRCEFLHGWAVLLVLLLTLPSMLTWRGEKCVSCTNHD
jgi:hypothetical protein